MKYRRFFIALLFLTSATIGFGVDYETEIHPILKSRCGKCHMEGESKGKVALDKHLIHKEINDSGTIIAGSHKKSDLHWTMTLDPDDDSAMPPKGRRVPKAEIDLIAQWINEGAKIGSDSGSMGGDSMSGDSMSGDSMGGDSMGGDSMGGGGMAAAPVQKPYKGTFKNNKGKQVPATLTRIDGDRAILILPDGKEYRYPITMFAPESQALVEKFKAGTLAPSE